MGRQAVIKRLTAAFAIVLSLGAIEAHADGDDWAAHVYAEAMNGPRALRKACHVAEGSYKAKGDSKYSCDMPSKIAHHVVDLDMDLKGGRAVQMTSRVQSEEVASAVFSDNFKKYERLYGRPKTVTRDNGKLYASWLVKSPVVVLSIGQKQDHVTMSAWVPRGAID